MAKFEKKNREGGRDRSRRGSGEQRSGGAKKDSYKSKRSFTKNKSLRETQKDGEKREGHFRPSFRRDKDAASSGRPASREFSEREKKDERAPRPRVDREEHFRPSYRRDKDAASSGRPARREFSEREKKDERSPRTRVDREERFDKGQKSRGYGEEARSRGSKPDKPFRSREERSPRRDDERRPERKTGPGGERRGRAESKPERRVKHGDFETGRVFGRKKESEPEKAQPKKKNDDGLIRLNKYLSNAGVASRREADLLIQSGSVKVNGQVVDQLGYKIKPTDVVTYGDSQVKSERKIYLLLNKPKDYITTVDDPRERKTVMELVAGACRERIYPVGRLDRNTTGLLLFTNDGELTTKLTHPKHGIKKVYHVTLNKGLRADDFRSIVEGIELEDGPVQVDDLAFVGEGKKEIGIEIHSGRNRIVRRIFEHLGYDVLKLDRVVFAGLTKKDLPRGKYRFLTPKEVSFLQMIG